VNSSDECTFQSLCGSFLLYFVFIYFSPNELQGFVVNQRLQPGNVSVEGDVA
jgi:hypothetical protein